MSVLARIGTGVRRAGSYFAESWQELKKVKWPTRRELVTYTGVVLGTVAALAVFFYLIDVILGALVMFLMR
ncbi:preprotein translocase subunit SecE [Hydrogenibacillus schlegelii]|uniref:Protein translocase subunit SecE n=1 Tax=Hydrogenibacillus schlegelii TaxID=1484 RepID=A0A132N8Z8_HYDSH|nr:MULTISPECIES: preprotein translocase subunit SecE [Hydrogenibacillus]KWX06012.1 preprotein translocase subunit SecE [Hydrogenibacillus schlegelii]MBE3563224.1 preprotein translocase subunit SecE [Hydrogenibacillus schlegelii]MBT9283143.1 preprotein translocase subunit SecE [Hydrogenibacillus schlegelii]OAR04551.1 preprotein translocase subunit SecE [Hydrogenibacillus schlegelii]PTQ52875.1 MAG: hypothetical protein HSCHL_2654 [Hydrogenibacillus schlegelii]